VVVIRLLVGTRVVCDACVVVCRRRVSAVARGVSGSGVVIRRRVLIVARGVVGRGVAAVRYVIDASTAGIV